jgi:hypothetical protein
MHACMQGLDSVRGNGGGGGRDVGERIPRMMIKAQVEGRQEDGASCVLVAVLPMTIIARLALMQSPVA